MKILILLIPEDFENMHIPISFLKRTIVVCLFVFISKVNTTYKTFYDTKLFPRRGQESFNFRD